MSILCYKNLDIEIRRSELRASILTDIMVGAVAVHVVPEVITEDRAGDVLYKSLQIFGINRICC